MSSSATTPHQPDTGGPPGPGHAAGPPVARQPPIAQRAVLELLFVAALAGLSGWYLWDAVSVSTRVANLILIAPGVTIILVLCLSVIVSVLRHPRRAAPPQDDALGTEAAPPPARSTVWRILALMVLVGLFVWMLPYGFDVVTFGFVAGSLVLLGERNPLVIIGYPALFAALVVWGLRNTLSYSIPGLIL